MLDVSGPRLIAPKGEDRQEALCVAWALTGLGLAVVAAAAAIAVRGFDRHGLELALRLTARIAFFAFWPAYTGTALVRIFGSRFEPLRRRARAFGLTFAAVMVVHLSLVVGVCAIRAPPPARVFIVFGPGAAFTFILAAASLGSVSRVMSARNWSIPRNVMMNYLAFDFLVDFTNSGPLTSARALTEYLPFAAFAVAGPMLRLAADLKDLRSSLSASRSAHLR